MSSLLTAPSRPRRAYKRIVWGLLSAVFFILLLALAARVVLVRRMVLPRLTLTQSAYVLAVALTPDGKTLLTGGDTLDYPQNRGRRPSHTIPADVLVWDTASGRLLRRLHGLTLRSSAVSVSPDGRLAFAAGTTRAGRGKRGWSRVLAWDIATGRQIWMHEGDAPLSVSADGRFIGSAGAILRVADGIPFSQTTASPLDGSQSEFTPDSRSLALIGAPDLAFRGGASDRGDGDRGYYAPTRLRLWHTDTGKSGPSLPFTRVRAFDFFAEGRELIMACDTGEIFGGLDGSVLRRVNLATGKVLWERARSMNGPSPDPDAVLSSVIISPDGKYVVLQSLTSRLIVLDARTGAELFRPFVRQGKGDPSWLMPGGVAFSADGRTLVSRCGNRVLVWDARVLHQQ